MNRPCWRYFKNQLPFQGKCIEGELCKYLMYAEGCIPDTCQLTFQAYSSTGDFPATSLIKIGNKLEKDRDPQNASLLLRQDWPQLYPKTSKWYSSVRPSRIFLFSVPCDVSISFVTATLRSLSWSPLCQFCEHWQFLLSTTGGPIPAKNLWQINFNPETWRDYSKVQV